MCVCVWLCPHHDSDNVEIKVLYSVWSGVNSIEIEYSNIFSYITEEDNVEALKTEVSG